MDYKSLQEAYASVYEERELITEEYDEELLDYMTEEAIDEVVSDLFSEGYTEEDIVETFEIILEKMTPKQKEMRAKFKAQQAEAGAATDASKRKNLRAKAVADAKSKVMDKVKSGVRMAKASAKSVKDTAKKAVAGAKEAGREAKFQAVDKKVAAYANKRNLHPAPGMAARSKDPEKRRGLRSRVADDIKGRAVAKASRGAVKAYGKGREVAQSASDTAGRAKQSAKNMAARAGRAAGEAKAGVKSALGKVARKVADKAGAAASRLGEEADSFDIVLDYLITEGYAETEAAAIKIMATMSDEWREGILDEAGRMHSSSAQQAGFQRIKDMESGGPGAGKVRSDDEIRKEKGGQAFLDKIAATKKKMK